VGHLNEALDLHETVVPLQMCLISAGEGSDSLSCHEDKLRHTPLANQHAYKASAHPYIVLIVS